MTDRYDEWRDFYAKRVSSWMSLEELRTACGKLATTDSPSPEVLLIHAMHALEECVQRDEAMRAEDDAWCAECGAKLETVRPGKHQHPTCSQAALQRPAAVAQPLTDEALLRQALEALEGVAQWVEKRPDTHPWDAWQRVEPAIAALRIALEQQAQAQPVYRCHIDLEEGMEPDDCVLDSGRRDDCFYARLHGDRAREHCGEWKPIQIAKHPPQPRRMGGADGG